MNAHFMCHHVLLVPCVATHHVWPHIMCGNMNTLTWHSYLFNSQVLHQHHVWHIYQTHEIILSCSDNDSHMLAQFLLVPCVATLCVWQYGHTLPYAPCAAYIWFFLPQPCFVSPMCGWGLR